MPKVRFIIALNAEVPFLFRDTSIVHQLNDNYIEVVVSGMGQKNAGIKTKFLCESIDRFSPDYLINLGSCGATNDRLNIGDLIIANRLSNDKQEIQIANKYIDKAKDDLKGIKHYVGKLQTFNWPVFSRRSVSEDTLAVDMESFVIGITAIKYQIPVVVIKIVSDIVPVKASAVHMWQQLKSISDNKNLVQRQLDNFVKHHLCESSN
jgi:nucleoside phosphorylase